ncbi:hypothetical protein LJC63_00945 [Ruminococcaceae bacterium OttesenSCG-928-L11]|nr:hypothetical protein [Ruminococcaceae bacterium OttesenSCG-928-L11]
MDDQQDRPCSINATINPKYLIGCHDDYIATADSTYLTRLIERFNYEAMNISPMLKEFNSYSLNRIDYCVNFDLAELGIDCVPEIYMALIKRADIPPHFEERKEYVKDDGGGKFHRKKSGADSFFLINNSLRINCYNKYAQMKRKDPDNPNLENYRNIVRFEIQYRYPKILYLKNQTKDWDTFVDLMSILQSDEVCKNELTKYYNKTIGKGDYYTLDGARSRIRSMNFCASKESRLMGALKLVNQCRGVFRAKNSLTGAELAEFKRSLRDLGEIGVNPVTIPREGNIKYLPNLMSAYLIQAEETQRQFEEYYHKPYFG